MGSNTKENSLTTRPHAKHKISAEEFEVSGALWVTVAITNFKHSPSLTRLTKPFPEGLAKEKVYSPPRIKYIIPVSRDLYICIASTKIMQYMTWQEKKKSEVKKQSLGKILMIHMLQRPEGKSNYLYAYIYKVDQLLSRLTKKHKEKTHNNIRNKNRALL